MACYRPKQEIVPHPCDKTAMMVQLTQGRWATFDVADLPVVRSHRWHWSKGYAKTRIGGHDTAMHHLLIEVPDGMLPDHADRDPLNNRRSNLRVASHPQNAVNAGKRSNNTSGYTGVSWDRGKRKWTARLARRHLGYFADIREAAHAYDAEARRVYGEYAVLNLPEETVR